MAREVRRVDIFFKDPNNTFMAGEMVQGEVTLDLGAEVKAKGKLPFIVLTCFAFVLSNTE